MAGFFCALVHPKLRNRSVAVRPAHRLDITLRGGCAMEILAVIAGNLFAPALLTAGGHFVLRLLPLVSDRVNDRAVRLAKAKNKQSN
jgi:hypothetical protein